jgi:hypothetical protein
VDKLGFEAQFENYSPMPVGKYFDYWNGRLLTADKNIIYFSEPLAYHLNDEKYGFVMLPQRITFIACGWWYLGGASGSCGVSEWWST